MIRDERGAVYVEMLIAFPVVWVAFLGAYMFAYICAADLILERAASAAARAASVFMADLESRYPQNGGDAARVMAVREAARRVSMASPGIDPGSVAVDVSGDQSNWSALTTRVRANFDCRPFLVGILCGPDFTVSLSADASMPFQGP